MTTQADIEEVKKLLARFKSGKAIDDPEELLDMIPDWLETITELWERIPEEERA